MEHCRRDMFKDRFRQYATGRQKYIQEEGIVFLRSQNVYDDGLRLHDVAYIDAVTHAKMSGTAVRPAICF